ncbi:MAG: hypothetical protein KAV87_55395, partial [Desulfobacteraceae bacterium]|nr:hypothetical protein [Desulfobacteraceae bacterium]
ATIMEMASSEILSHIPANIYEEIKAKDSHPEFRAYVVGHEGISTGKIVGRGDYVKRWFASAIEKIVEKLQYGTKIFHTHGKTNVHSGRGVIGQIVGKAKQIIDDNLSAVAIAYIKPDYRDLKLDVASIEADVTLNDGRDSGIYDANVEDITGIALGNSSTERPGFSGATLLSSIQAFAEKTQYNKGDTKMSDLTVSEVRSFIKAENLVPSDLFGIGDLTKDPTIEAHIEEKSEQVVHSEIERRKKINKGFNETKEELIKVHEEAIKDKDKIISGLQSNTIKTKAPEWLEVQKEKRNLNDEQMKFINRNMSKFEPKEHDKAEAEFNQFLDDQVDDFAGIQKDVFGKEPSTDKDKTKLPGGETKDKTKDTSQEIEDMSLTD